jgi:hypothetical protein
MPRIALISSVIPRPQLGGEVILWRHLQAMKQRFPDFELLIVTNVSVPDGERLHARYLELRRKLPFRRYQKTRLGFLYHDYKSLGLGIRLGEILDTVREFNPDLILTVVHGELFIPAVRAAKVLRKPLVSIFHDWWPDVPPVSRMGRFFLERKFKEAGCRSAKALCVCENMARDIGCSNTTILYPVPSPEKRLPASGTKKQSEVFLVRYAGTLQGTYGRMVFSLFKALSCHPGIRFEICGNSPNWTSSEMNEVGSHYKGLLPANEFSRFLAGSDMLLVVMSFDKSERRRARTSFPSKIVEYCAYGKPMLLWAPEYASASEWSGEAGVCITVNQNDPEAVVKQLEVNTPEVLTTLGDRACELAETVFSFDSIQSQFESCLFAVQDSPVCKP